MFSSFPSVVIEKARLEYLCERAKIIDSYDSGVASGNFFKLSELKDQAERNETARIEQVK